MTDTIRYTVTLTHPDGTVVTELVIPVLQEQADATGNASSRLHFAADADVSAFQALRRGETALRRGLAALEHDACTDANTRAVTTARVAEQRITKVGVESALMAVLGITLDTLAGNSPFNEDAINTAKAN